jgi:predicted dehydrogenase
MSQRNRREFLEDSMFATAAALAATSATPLLAKEKKKTGANDRLRVAVLGVHGRGNSHIGGFALRGDKGDTEVVAICDVDEKVGNKRAEEVAKRQNGRKPKYIQDLRRVFDDPNIDIVTIATPNHWHALAAIWAIQAGKDVYVEKPVSHNVSEGRRIVDAARKYKKICQTGTQSRSSQGLHEAIQALRDGLIGKVALARGLCYKRRGSIGQLDKPLEIPSHIDYDLWCGPAKKVDLYRPHLHYDWHWDFNTGNGDLGNQGIHQMDIARWGLGADALSRNVVSYGGRFGYEDAANTPNTEVTVHDYGDKTLVFEVRGLKTDDYKGAKIGVIFEGSEGYAVVPSYHSATFFDKNGKVIKKFNGGGNHFDNFIEAVRSRDHHDLNADIEEGHISSALCHTGNISYQLGGEASGSEVIERLKSNKTNEDVAATFDRFEQHLADNKVNLDKTKLRLGAWLPFDPKTESFVDNSQADALLTRDYRAPFVVPTKDQV